MHEAIVSSELEQSEHLDTDGDSDGEQQSLAVDR